MVFKKIIKWPVINLFIFYLLSEIILGLLSLPQEYKARTHPLQFSRVTDEEILYVNLPDSEIIFEYDGNPRGYFKSDNRVIHQTNKYGFRGPEFSLEKPKNTKRIIFLGDSFTLGEGVYFEDTFPEKFARLAKEQKLFVDKKIEVINLGVGGYNTQQEWALFKNFARQLEPDLVVLAYTLNDAESPLFTAQGKGMIRRIRETEVQENLVISTDTPFYFKFSRLIRAFWRHYENQKRTEETIAFYRALYKEEEQDWQNTKKAIVNLANYSKAHEVPILVLLFPILHELNEDYPLIKIHQKVSEAFETCNLKVIDLLPFLTGRKAQDLWVHPTDQHPNEIVHEVTAQALMESF